MRVFGYGSLAAARPDAPAARLRGYAATWGVAMDNAVAIPGYKRYVDPSGAHAPAVFVAFLDAHPCPGAVLDGVLVDLTPDQLEALDRRERNYDRIDVAAALEDGRAGAPVWLYAGSADGRRRAVLGRARGRLVVQRDYLEAVRAGLGRLGAAVVEPDCPVVDLVRVDLAA